MDDMAYLRSEKETVEMDYPLAKVWDAVHKAVAEVLSGKIPPCLARKIRRNTYFHSWNGVDNLV